MGKFPGIPRLNWPIAAGQPALDIQANTKVDNHGNLVRRTYGCKPVRDRRSGGSARMRPGAGSSSAGSGAGGVIIHLTGEKNIIDYISWPGSPAPDGDKPKSEIRESSFAPAVVETMAGRKATADRSGKAETPTLKAKAAGRWIFDIGEKQASAAAEKLWRTSWALGSGGKRPKQKAESRKQIEDRRRKTWRPVRVSTGKSDRIQPNPTFESDE